MDDTKIEHEGIVMLLGYGAVDAVLLDSGLVI
ncbi:hypothetical protein J2T60_001967 [Natronospira proteinivora]|uniref:Uncharacterized protein n=1 Tax=Natronospira proteinivora TaxID=1807133 RepID=A0ABT1G9H8_9GAMM|nr:hypothetical protein [Natronospira proteinivora]